MRGLRTPKGGLPPTWAVIDIDAHRTCGGDKIKRPWTDDSAYRDRESDRGVAAEGNFCFWREVPDCVGSSEGLHGSVGEERCFGVPHVSGDTAHRLCVASHT